jgi:tetratricopeptide (TPR) repeat protein
MFISSLPSVESVMAKIARNAPCPCGSGKKYKRCCLLLQQRAPANPLPASQPIGIAPGAIVFDDKLDQLSNSVVDLIKEGKLDEAEAVCKQLSKRYPDQVDGIERRAMVEQARGNYAQAAQYYLEAAAFIQGKPGFDPEMEHWFRQMAADMEQKAIGQ